MAADTIKNSQSVYHFIGYYIMVLIVVLNFLQTFLNYIMNRRQFLLIDNNFKSFDNSIMYSLPSEKIEKML